ncbi:unnamed protein product [Chrysodeixis includens]|uniref:Uncharacterized protein n=1 Tax=Chrysodeixis includens TaxID=689277 RepID=A0A9P0BM86_CHRIL|nr:unnamed protein product [Chrysodeixis includens]
MDSESVDQSVATKPDDGVKTEDFIEIEIPFNLYEYLSSQHCNVQNMCRICLSTQNEVLYPLLATKENDILAQMFIELTNIQLLAEDGLPTSICELCQTQMVHCYEFKTKCEKSNCMLKSLLKGDLFAKDEITDQNMIVKDEEVLENNNVNESESVNNDMKNNTEFVEDVQYLEDLSDGSDNDNLCIVQNENTKKRTNTRTFSNDSSSLLKRVPKRKRQGKTKERKGKQLSCLSCSKVFFKISAFQDHMRICHPNVNCPHICGQCSEPFNSEHDLEVHSVLHTKGNPWKCSNCPKEFTVRSTLRRHIQRHMQSKRYSCDICNKAFTEMYALRRHVRVHTGEHVEKKHVCHICDKRYSEAGLLAAHVARHVGLRPCECGACGKRFSSARLLASHTLVHDDAKPYVCRYCDKRFRHESTRNTHHRTHTGEKPYVCSTCGKSFIQNSNLTLHMRTHTGERPYACSQCDRRFTSGSSLKSHERIHSGERPYSCNICGKRFSRKNLSAHMRHHTGERPFECSVCPKKFANATRLRDHHRVHTGEKPFECAMCPLKFATKSQQIKHIKSHQTSKKKRPQENQEIFIVQSVEADPTAITDRVMFNKEHGELITVNEATAVESQDNEAKQELTLNIVQEVPIEVTGELVLHDDSHLKAELLVVDNSHNIYQEENKTELVVDNSQNEYEGHNNAELAVVDNSQNNYQEDNLKTGLLVVDNSHNEYQENNNTELLVVDNSQNEYQEDNLLNTNNVNIIENDVNYDGDVNLVTLNEGEVSISTSNLEGTTVKLYQLDQSLVQIHSAGGQVTISKITSKMTANF